MAGTGVRAQIHTREGWPVQHAVLTVTDMTGVQVLRVEADDEGVAQTEEGLPAGPYTVIATALGFAPAASTALVTASGRADLGTLELVREGGFELPPPGTYTVDPVHSTVGATAHHLGISSVHVRFTEFSVRLEIDEEPERSFVEAIIEAGSIQTGNEMRDAHLRSEDFLNVEKHPQLTYRSHTIDPAGTDRWTVHGWLAMHGVVRDVALDMTYLGFGPDPWGGQRAAFKATAELQREDFAITYNQIVAAGITAIGTKLKIELDIQAVQGDTLPSLG